MTHRVVSPFIRRSLSAALCGVLLAIVHSAHAAEADARAARATLVGLQIASGAEFSAHTQQATATPSGPRCVIAAGPDPVAAADLEQRRKAHQAEYTRLMNERAAATDALHRRSAAGEISREEHRRQVTQEIPARFRAAFQEWERAGAQLQVQQVALQGAATRVLAIHFQHAPSDATATIIPLANNFPTQAYVGELNRTLGAFLRTCPDGLQVSILHYFRDVFPYGQAAVQNGRMREREIAGFAYVLRNGTLALDTEHHARVGTRNLSGATLANFRARVETEQQARESNARTREAAASLARADYRNDYVSASRRKAGIVYRYDPYWAQYRKFELARRLFDGDFSNGTESIHFKSVYYHYAAAYSAACKAHVKEFREFHSTVNEVVGTRDNPVTNLPENQYASRTVTTRIDARFADRYAAYENAVQKAVVTANLDNLRNGKAPNMTNMTTGQFRDVLGKVMQGDYAAGGISYPEWIDGRFFENHACTSATMTQMGENILRAAAGRESLQASGTRLAGAERESDPPKTP